MDGFLVSFFNLNELPESYECFKSSETVVDFQELVEYLKNNQWKEAGSELMQILKEFIPDSLDCLPFGFLFTSAAKIKVMK